MINPQYTVMVCNDYPEMLKLWRDAPETNLTKADGEDEIASYLARNECQSFICRIGTEIVGTILCGNDGRRAFIHHLVVKPDCRRQGIDKCLVDLAVQVQKAHGIERVAI